MLGMTDSVVLPFVMLDSMMLPFVVLHSAMLPAPLGKSGHGKQKIQRYHPYDHQRQSTSFPHRPCSFLIRMNLAATLYHEYTGEVKNGQREVVS